MAIEAGKAREIEVRQTTLVVKELNECKAFCCVPG